MFCGEFNSYIDGKGRLYIPELLKKQLDKNVLLKMGEHECIEIHTVEHGALEKVLENHWDPSIVFEAKIQKAKKRGRVTIPKPLRDSDSFYLGNTVTMVCMGSYIRILPRPS